MYYLSNLLLQKPRRVVRASSDEEDAAGDSERVKESLKEQLFEGPAEAPVEEAQPAPAAQDLAEEVDEEDEEDGARSTQLISCIIYAL